MTEKDCNDYILRGDVVGAVLLSNRVFKTGFYSDEIISDTIEAAVKAVEILPAADVAPVVHGRWVTEYEGLPFCSVCDYDGYGYMFSPYCPNCGAKMDENTEQIQTTD